MRAYLLKVCGIFIIAAVCEIILPDGNTKKYAKILMSLVICITLLSPCEISFTEGDTFNFDMPAEESFEEMVESEYIGRVEKLLSEKCGCVCRVYVNEDMTIKKIAMEGVCGEEGRRFIVEELGVSEENIECKKER